MYSSIGLLLVFFLAAISDRPAQGDISGLQAGVSDGGKNGNPGVKIRFTQNGLNYLNDVVRYQMSVIIPRLRMDDMTFKNLGGSATVSNARITKYKAPDTQTMTFQTPNQVIVSMRGMDVSMTGHVQATSGLLSDQGDFDGAASNVDVTYTLKIIRQSNGQFGVKTQNCKAKVGDCDVELSNFGPLGTFIGALKGLMIANIKPEIGKQICAQGTLYFDDSANKQLGQIPTKIWLNETDPELMAHVLLNHGGSGHVNNGPGGSGNQQPNQNGRSSTTRGPSTQRGGSGSGGGSNGGGDADEMRKFLEMSKNITKHLMLDYSNIKDPVVSKDKRYLETYNKGEISYHGQGGTPFYPNDLREPSPYPAERMAYLIASDYVANSMLHQSFTHGLLNYRINADDTPDFAQYLRTSCESDFFSGDMCLGSLIPQVQEAFPNSVAEIYVEANRVAPAIFFQQDGMIRIQAPVTLTLNAKNGQDKKLMAVADVDVTARAKLYIESQMLKGNLSVDKVDVKMKQNNIKGFDQKGIDELASSAKNVMGVMGNMYLRKGLPLPVVNGMKLTNTAVNVYDRTIRLDSDVQVDQATLSKMAAKAIRESGKGASVDGIEDTGTG